MGFTAIWISPVVENVKGLTADGNSYHGYWARWIDSINSNFGTPSDLQALSSALHSRGMYLMVDVVTNHMGYEGCGTCVDYSIYDVFNNEEYYHPYCPITNYNDPTNAQTCTTALYNLSCVSANLEQAGRATTLSRFLT
jgi:alpha-amylase